MKLLSSAVLTFAFIVGGVVTNIILWDGVTSYNPGAGVTLVQSNVAEIGDVYNGTNFLYNAQVLNETSNTYYNEVESR